MENSSDKTGAGSLSTRPYLIRALHDWCTDNGFTPYIAVHVDRFVQVPMEYVSNNEIVLNVGFEATSSLDLGNEFIQFKARFGGTAREIIVPVDHVVAIYARENGQGMAFPAPELRSAAEPSGAEGPGAPQGAPAASEARANPLRAVRLAPASAAADAGMAEDLPQTESAPSAAASESQGGNPEGEPDGPGPSSGRPALKRVK